MSADGPATPEYFYNTRTQMVEKGRQSSWEHLMGPYASEDEARRALETAQQRTEAWDDEDADWNEPQK